MISLHNQNEFRCTIPISVLFALKKEVLLFNEEQKGNVVVHEVTHLYLSITFYVHIQWSRRFAMGTAV